MTTRRWFDSLVKEARRDFRFYSKRKRTVEGHEIEFHCVGCNASHFFSIGILPDGRLATYSIGESAREIAEEADCLECSSGEETVCQWCFGSGKVMFYSCPMEEHAEILEPGEFPCYLGHA